MVAKRVLTSSTEAECHALYQAEKENIWIRDFLIGLKILKTLKPTKIFEDNKSAITLIQSVGVQHKKVKHWDNLELNWLKEKYQKKDFEVSYIETERQVADMLTKSLPREAFENQSLGGPEIQRSFPRAGR